MLRWLNMLWRAISHWYTKPRKIHKNTANNHEQSAKIVQNVYGSRLDNSDTARRENTDIRIKEKHELERKQVALVNSADSNKALGFEVVKRISSLQTNNSGELFTESRTDTARPNTEQTVQNNGYLIPERLHGLSGDHTRICRNKSKSVSPPPSDSVNIESKDDEVQSRCVHDDEDETRTAENERFNPTVEPTRRCIQTATPQQIAQCSRKKTFIGDTVTQRCEKTNTEVEWTERTVDTSTQDIVESPEIKTCPGGIVTLESVSKTFSSETNGKSDQVLAIETENEYQFIKESIAKCSVTTGWKEIIDVSSEKYPVLTQNIRPNKLQIQSDSEDYVDGATDQSVRLQINGARSNAKMAYRRSVSADSSPYRMPSAPSYEPIRVYEQYLEKEIKEKLAKYSERRKSLETSSHDYLVPVCHTSQDKYPTVKRLPSSQIIISRSSRLRMSKRTTRSMDEILGTRSTFLDNFDLFKSRTKDYLKFGSSSRMNLSEGMIRHKIREHMSNIIGKQLHAGDDEEYRLKLENPLYAKDGMETDNDSTVTSDIDINSEQNGLRTDEDSEDCLADDENDEVMNFTVLNAGTTLSKPVDSSSDKNDEAINKYALIEDQTVCLRSKPEEVFKKTSQFDNSYSKVMNLVSCPSSDDATSVDITKDTVDVYDYVIAADAEAVVKCDYEDTFDLQLSLVAVNFKELTSLEGLRKINNEDRIVGEIEKGLNFCSIEDIVPKEDVLTPIDEVSLFYNFVCCVVNVLVEQLIYAFGNLLNDSFIHLVTY